MDIGDFKTPEFQHLGIRKFRNGLRGYGNIGILESQNGSLKCRTLKMLKSIPELGDSGIAVQFIRQVLQKIRNPGAPEIGNSAIDSENSRVSEFQDPSMDFGIFRIPESWNHVFRD